MVRRSLDRGTSLVNEDWQDLDKLTSELSKWRHRKFEKEQLNSIPEQAGLYLISAAHSSLKTSDRDYFLPIYVGQEKNLRSRVGQHISGASSNDSIQRAKSLFVDQLFVWFLPITLRATNEEMRKRELDDIERAFIRCVRAVGNDQGIPAIQVTAGNFRRAGKSK